MGGLAVLCALGFALGFGCWLCLTHKEGRAMDRIWLVDLQARPRPIDLSHARIRALKPHLHSPDSRLWTCTGHTTCALMVLPRAQSGQGSARYGGAGGLAAGLGFGVCGVGARAVRGSIHLGGRGEPGQPCERALGHMEVVPRGRTYPAE